MHIIFFTGFFSLIATMATFASMWYFGCGVRMIYDKFYQLMAISTLYSFVLSFALYVRAAKATSAQLADSGNTGNWIDFLSELQHRIDHIPRSSTRKFRFYICFKIVFQCSLIVLIIKQVISYNQKNLQSIFVNTKYHYIILYLEMLSIRLMTYVMILMGHKLSILLIQ